VGRVGKTYRRIRAAFTDQPTFFSWVKEGRLAASGLPSSSAQVRWLAGQRITSVLSLTETALPTSWFDGLGVESKHTPMADHAPPAQEALREASEYIYSQLRGNSVVLVHCQAGKGRTGCAIAAYMIAHEGKTAKEALDYLREIRPGSVEAPQESSIYEFERRIREAKTQQYTETKR